MEENKKWKSPERLAIVALVIALVFTLAGFEIASAAVNNPDGSINTCYKGKNGNLRVRVTACKASETPLTLAGPDSDPIVAGHHDAPVSFAGTTTIATLTIPTAGSYAVSAKAIVFNGAGSPSLDGCGLTGPVNFDGSQATVASGEQATVAMQIGDTFGAGSTVTLACHGGSASQEAFTAKITAIAGTTLTNSAL